TRPQSAQRARFVAWEAIERVDDLTVRVRTKAPDPRFLITLVQVQVMPPGVLRTNPDSLAERPIGTGPFKLVEWVKGERIVLEANDDHWRGRPKIDRITFRAVPEASARVATLQAGQADLVLNVPPESIPLLERGANTKVLSVASTRNVTIIFDNRTSPFSDVRVRQAMNYAVDKESLNRNILGGRALIQATPSHPLTFGHNADVKPYPYDPQKARDLLAQAGYPSGFTTEFHHPTGRWLKDVEVVQAVAGMLEKVGVRSKLLTREYNTFFSTWAKGELKGMAMIGTLSQIDADRTVLLFLHAQGSFPHYSRDPKVDALYEQAQTLDLTRREQILRDMERYIHEQAPWLFLYFQPDLFGANKKLQWVPPKNERLVLWDADLES
ncbi:MAG TPA: ABC transporter substrate-binding protein, partial [Methylomirabilota bacterium]|nr:ABC transporter substrate-binding protein [Methylomirabilota bacterium]